MGTGELDAARLTVARDKVDRTLRELGIAEDISSRIADEVLTAVEQHRHAG
jgi:hypothetical protein